jgi:hypothetical protein
MGMTFFIGRTLFARMPPSIVINEPLPLWKAIVQSGLRITGVVLLCAGLFYAGMYFERYRQGLVRPAQATPSPSEQAQQAPAIPEASKQDVMTLRQVEGLDIQALTVVRDSASPGLLRYEFAISNEGRLYEGTLEFLVQGVLEGRPTVWTYPPEGQRAGGKFQMRVGRYLKTEGSLQLPAGLVPEVVALRLREASGGIRASRGVSVAPTEQN